MAQRKRPRRRPSQLPSSFRPLLWSLRFSRVDPRVHRVTVVRQALNYGTLDHWRWIRKFYGDRELRRILSSLPEASVRARVRPLAKLLLGVRRFDHAPRRAHR